MTDLTTQDIDAMSDEDILNMADPEEPVQEEADTTIEDTNTEPTEAETASDDTPEETTTDDTQEEVENNETKEGDASEEQEAETTTDADEESTTEGQQTESLNYEEEYKKLLAPFKANGKTAQIANVDEAIQLMQMGSNYNKKMAARKEDQKFIQMLDNNDLLNEDKLNRLIDLAKKDPKAITNLIKESGIDLDQVDPEEETNYVPNTYNVSTSEVDLKAVLSDIKDTESYATTINVISKEWDADSQAALAANPETIRYLNDQIANGVYEKINTTVQHQKMLGNLRGITDIQAYEQVGKYMNSQGLLNAPTKAPIDDTTTIPMPSKNTTPDPKVEKSKKSAGITKTNKSPIAVTNTTNVFDMSDEEFDKLPVPI